MLLEARNFLLSQNIWTFSGDHPTPCLMGNGAPYLGVKWQGVMLSTHLSLMRRLRLSGAIQLYILEINF